MMLFEDAMGMRERASLDKQATVDELCLLLSLMKALKEAGAPSSVPLTATIESMSDAVWVERSFTGSYITVRQTRLRQVERDAGFWSGRQTRLYGEFERRDHAERWARAIQTCAAPRYTRAVERRRAVQRNEPPARCL
ncbi:hypothetical protein NOVOSPHI9U_210005 [Novosphingobium sp. 9U]|nr:hypothetical protein NOVOSPHI9U_210005 [Novosphingobium sp. 9U]